MKCLRSDNGGEYKGPFKAHYKAYGIRHKKVSRKTPQLNRLAERMNRTIAKKVICMLSHSKLSKTFWGGVVKIAVDSINLSWRNTKRSLVWKESLLRSLKSLRVQGFCPYSKR